MEIILLQYKSLQSILENTPMALLNLKAIITVPIALKV